jgi:hypothetical protein
MNKLYEDLKKLHGLQWDKKNQLREVTEHLAALQSNMMYDALTIENHALQQTHKYVRLDYVHQLNKHFRSISRLTKDINRNRLKMKVIKGYIQVQKDFSALGVEYLDIEGYVDESEDDEDSNKSGAI